MKLFVIGHPVAHSISPRIQNAALEACGIDATYELLDTPPDRVAQTIAALRAPEVLGCNVTVPHKQAVMPYLDELSPEAARIGAVNAIARREGRLVGFNTDASGFLASLGEAGVEVTDKRVVLLGAGGAARAIALALAEATASALTILNRDPARAAALAEHVRPFAGSTELASGGLDPGALARQLPMAGLIVNATSVGMHGDQSLVPPDLVPAESVVCDIIYNPPETALLRSASEAGARPINGLGMLVHQAAAAFAIWTGQPAPVATMYEAASRALEHLRARA